jgi:hypothetical protein
MKPGTLGGIFRARSGKGTSQPQTDWVVRKISPVLVVRNFHRNVVAQHEACIGLACPVAKGNTPNGERARPNEWHELVFLSDRYS